MNDPKVEGDFASFDKLRDGLADLLRTEIAGAYLVWMSANAQAVANDGLGATVGIGDAMFTQKPQRYAAKAYSELRRKRRAVSNDALTELLNQSGVDAFLLVASEADANESDQESGEEDAGGEE